MSDNKHERDESDDEGDDTKKQISREEVTLVVKMPLYKSNGQADEVRRIIRVNWPMEAHSIFYCSTGTSNQRTSILNGTYFETAGIALGDIRVPILTVRKDTRHQGHIIKMSDIYGSRFIRTWQTRLGIYMSEHLDIIGGMLPEVFSHIIFQFFNFASLQVSAFMGSLFWGTYGTLREWILTHDYDERLGSFQERQRFSLYVPESVPELTEGERDGRITRTDENGSIRIEAIMTQKNATDIIEDISYYTKVGDEMKLEARYPPDKDTQPPEEDTDTQPPEEDTDTQPPEGGSRRKRKKHKKKTKKTRKTKKTKKTKKTRKTKKTKKTIYKHRTK
jgi:hypothetical protein